MSRKRGRNDTKRPAPRRALSAAVIAVLGFGGANGAPAEPAAWTMAQAGAESQDLERRPEGRRPGREPVEPGAPAMPGAPAEPGRPPEAQAAPVPGREPLPAADLGRLGALPPVPDRWRIVDALGYPRNLWDPYNTANLLKADRPFAGDWFFNVTVTSDTVIEPRYVATPVGVSTTDRPGQLDTIGDGKQLLLNQLLAVELVLFKGDTVFRPPDYEVRFIPVFNWQKLRTEERGVVDVDPSEGTDRTETFAGVQVLFLDVELRTVSDRYDFDSIRVGIQPFTADFRGFLFLDQPFGVRFFGTRANNRFQYNLGWFRRLEKDIVSGLNDVSEGLRDDDVFVANLYWQDTPVLGFTSQATIVHNRNREADDGRFDEIGFLQRPSPLFEERGREYDVTYLGYSGDGHFGRFNLSGSIYYAFGDQSIEQPRNSESDISAWFAAAEASIDFDWIRLRLSGLYASGDPDPFDDEAEGFDAIFENPQFAGADTSYWVRQAIPFIGGGGVALTQRNAVLASLRPSKEQGQSNFVNPGLVLLGIGADFDLTPKVRLSANVNQLWFNETAVLEVLRQQGDIDEDIGTDVSLALTYRPLQNQNIVLRLSGAMLFPGDGYKQLYGDDEDPYSILANVILTY